MQKHELFEELEACNPRYVTQYATLREAAAACGVLPMFEDYLSTAQGRQYATSVASVPDVLSASKAQAEAADRLPYTLETIGLTAPAGE